MNQENLTKTPVEEPTAQATETNPEQLPQNRREEILASAICDFCQVAPSPEALSASVEIIRNIMQAKKDASEKGKKLDHDGLAQAKMMTVELANEMGFDPVALWDKVEAGILADEKEGMASLEGQPLFNR